MRAVPLQAPSDRSPQLARQWAMPAHRDNCSLPYASSSSVSIQTRRQGSASALPLAFTKLSLELTLEEKPLRRRQFLATLPLAAAGCTSFGKTMTDNLRFPDGQDLGTEA